jgi:predicted kinase
MSAIFQKQLNKSYLDMYDGVDTSQSSFKENVFAGAADQIARGNSNSRARMLEDAWQPFLDEIKNKTGQEFWNPARHLNKGLAGASATHGTDQWKYRHDSKKIFEFIKANEESLGPEFMTLNHDFIIDRAIKSTHHQAEQFDEVVERSGDWKNFLGRFVGAMGGSFDDPVIQDTMGLGLTWKTPAALWRLAFREALVGGGTEALIQTEVQEWYKELGLPYTWEQFALNVSAASALSGAFPLTFRIGGEVVKLSGSQAKKGYEAIKNAHKSIGQEVSENARTAENIADEIESTIGTSPINDVDEHLDRVDAHADAIGNGEAPTVTNEPASGPTAAELENVANPGKYGSKLEEVNEEITKIFEARDLFAKQFKEEEEAILLELDQLGQTRELTNDDFFAAYERIDALESKKNLNDANDLLLQLNDHKKGLEISVEMEAKAKAEKLEAKPRATINDVVSRFEVDELNVDAKAFQFKEGGDEFGVTERLKDVKTWDPVKAGTVVVYEQADGKLFIADGHQRLGLAKRIKSQDPKQDVFLLGSVLREKDGISRDQAMVVAAMKNIAEGTGTVLDAVKVLKGDQKLFKELPPRSALVRMARNIVNINDDEAFGLFKNGLVSPQQAAVVGRMIPEDATMQRAAMNVLAKAKPENDVQAESIVRQVMDSGTEKVNQESLFGNALEEESLYFERAKVLDNAVKILQRDKSAFNTIVKNQTKFESEGNQLARSANEQKIQKDGQAIQLIQTLANRRGQLSDDLTAAARVAKQSGQYNKATDSFVQSVRGAVDRGDFNGEILSDPGLAIDAPPQNGTIPTRAVEKSLDDFDDPAGLGSQKQMDQMEADMFQQPPEVKPREAFQSDDELRNDLGNIIEQGADETVVDAHPAVTKAIEESMARPETTTLPGYGTDQFRQTRSFNTLSLQKLGVKLENTITGYTDAIVALYKGARNLAWKDDGLDLPVGKYINQDKRAAIVLGPPAAGKSTLANPIARRMNAAIIDSDEAKKILPEYDGGIGANAVHEESSALAERVLNMALELGDNVVIPKVGGTVGSIEKLVNKLKEKGYSVDLVDMSVTYKNARNRMFLRFVKTGRLINPDYVRQVGDNPGKTYDTLKQQGKADGYTRIDNNGQIDKPKDLIEDTSGLTQGSDIRLRRSGGERDPGGELAGSQERGFRGAEEITDGELDLEIPVGQRIDDATNEVTVVNQTMRQIKDEIDYENKMIDRMGYCVK